MIQPSEFGVFLKNKRNEAHLSQGELAEAIGKSGQYISNIEKGKNNSPPHESDIEALMTKLKLSPDDARKFRAKAAADRNRLPQAQMKYILSHPALLELICVAEERSIDDTHWETVLNEYIGGHNDDVE